MQRLPKGFFSAEIANFSNSCVIGKSFKVTENFLVKSFLVFLITKISIFSFRINKMYTNFITKQTAELFSFLCLNFKIFLLLIFEEDKPLELDKILKAAQDKKTWFEFNPIWLVILHEIFLGNC